jgi:hypothetical protein
MILCDVGDEKAPINNLNLENSRLKKDAVLDWKNCLYSFFLF